MKIFEKLQSLFGNKVEHEINQHEELDYPRFESAKEPWIEYFYPSTYRSMTGQGVFRNFYGLKDDFLLVPSEIAENFCAIKNTLKAKEIKGNLDLQHLRDIHKILFGDLYAWAGEPRVVHMLGKNGTNCFVHPDQFEEYSEIIFDNLKARNYLNGASNSKMDFASQLVDVYLEINNLHYFREGNGRAQNIFIAKLAERNGYNLNLSDFSKGIDAHKEYYAIFEEYRKGNKQALVDFFAERLI